MTVPRERMLGKRYALAQTIGVGGMAEVFLGNDTRLGRAVAVKVLRADLARDPSFHQRFRREAQSAASLNAPCIVAVYDTGEDSVDGAAAVPWIVMEYVEGRTLREVLDGEGRLLPRRALEIVADVCAALEVAHTAGIVHRDIKPGNVMLTPDGNVKVMDFGIARAAAGASQTMTQTAAVIGTAAYLSPEQARGDHVDSRSDVYSTGCLLYELLTGSPPFSGDSPVAVAYQHVREDPVPPSEWDSTLTPAVDAVVLKALAKNPANRYQSADLMRQDLLRAARGEVVEATPVLARGAEAPAGHGSVRVAGRRAPRKELVYGLFALLLLAVVLGAAFGVRALLAGSGTLVEAPALVGLTQQDAQARLAETGLRVGTVQPRFADKPVGTVLDQSPGRGIFVPEADPIDLVVSQGPERTLVPALVGRSKEEAEALLEQYRLARGRVIERDSAAPEGEVLDVIPAAGTELAIKQEVSLVVSSGVVDVPGVLGRAQLDAVERLRKAGFTVAVRFRPDLGRPGVVLAQSPDGKARRGSTVVIDVSAVPPPEPEPTVPAEPTPDPSASPTPSPPASATPSPTPTP